jgi:hypothetical protein
MSQTLQQVVPVVISILLIIVIAILRARSETLAAITATMPVTIPLSLWIVYAGSGGDPLTVTNFIAGLFVTMVANIFFVVAIWLAARAHWPLVPMLIVGYTVWGVVLGLLLLLRHILNR